MDFDITDQHAIIYSVCHKIINKIWAYNGAVHCLYIDFNTEYVSDWREVSYNIFNEFGIPMKLLRFIKMCSNEIYCKTLQCKHLWDTFPIQNHLKQGDALSPLPLNVVL